MHAPCQGRQHAKAMVLPQASNDVYRSRAPNRQKKHALGNWQAIAIYATLFLFKRKKKT
jgi:hypothetical protein